MLIKKRQITELSDKIRKAIDGHKVDFRDNREGSLSMLKNDIHTLVSLKSEQADAFAKECDFMAESIENISHQLKTPLTSMMIYKRAGGAVRYFEKCGYYKKSNHGNGYV